MAPSSAYTHRFADLRGALGNARSTHFKDDDFQDEVQVEEPVEAVSTPVEPLTGEKRPRSEEDEEMRHVNLAFSTEPSRAHSAPSNPTTTQAGHAKPEPTPQDVAMNGSYHSNGGHGGSGGNVDPSMMGYDGLYIGDLQWVRSLSCQLVLACAICSERLSPLPNACFYSGRRTRTCVKWP